MINKETALQAVLSTIQVDKTLADKSIIRTDIAFLRYQNMWEVIISFDEYDTIGDQFFVVFRVDPETGEVSDFFL